MNRILCKAVTLALGLFFSGAAVYAQSPTDTTQQPPAQSAPMSHSNPSDSTMPTADTPPSAWHGPDLNDPALNLTQDQKDKISRIQDDMHLQAKSVKSDSTLSEDQRKAKMKDIHHASEQQIMQVLTPDQQKTWKSLKGDMKRDKNAPAH
jgi:Spy/CpxP family protein refolding chaperone